MTRTFTPHARRRSRLALAALAVTTVVALLAGCSASPDTAGSASSAPQSGGTLTYARPASVTSFDLHNEITSNNAFAIDKVFEPLVAFTATGEIVPWLADDTISSDGLTYTFTLHDGVKFSDGTPVTSADVVFSLNRHLAVGGPLPLDAPIASITATDAKTIVITLKEAYTPLLSELAGFSNGILPANFGGKTEAEFFANPIGTGPFVVEKWDPAGDLTFTKNKNYWQPGKPYIDKLVYSLVADDTQQLQQLKAGQVSAIEDVPASNVEELKSNASVNVVSAGAWETEQVFFNTQTPYFGDVNVRRALALAIDRQGLTSATTFGTATVADALLPPTIAYSGNGVTTSLNLDVAAAKAELAKSKYPTGFTATLLIASGNAGRAQEAQIIQSAAASIGITLNIESIDLAAFRTRFKAYDFDLMINSGQSDSPDPNGMIAFQTDPDGFSKSYWTHYTNDRVTELAAQGRVTPDGDARKAIYLEIQQILADEVPFIPLFYPNNIKASLSMVHDLTVLPNASIRFEDAWIEGAK